MTNKPLTVEKAAPCMTCGSVQCAFCSDDVESAVEHLRERINRKIKVFSEEKGSETFIELINVAIEQSKYFLDAIDASFPVFKNKVKKNDN